MNTLILGAHRPLGLACLRRILSTGASAVAAVQAPHRIPPAVHDLREQHPAQLTALAWRAGDWPALPPIERVIIAELPIPPAQSDEGDDPAAELRALRAEHLAADVRALLEPTLAAIQLVTMIQPRRVLIQAS